MNADGTYFYDQVKNCKVKFSGDFSDTMASLAIGFLSSILWFFHSVHIFMVALSIKPQRGTAEVLYTKIFRHNLYFSGPKFHFAKFWKSSGIVIFVKEH